MWPNSKVLYIPYRVVKIPRKDINSIDVGLEKRDYIALFKPKISKRTIICHVISSVVRIFVTFLPRIWQMNFKKVNSQQFKKTHPTDVVSLFRG